ncbi:MAG: hypothetical protein WA208_02915 [Thermoanaerobaculia bacterium]
MKHGDKKGKSVKAATQASAKEKRSEVGGKKAAAGKAGGKSGTAKASAKKQGAGKEEAAAPESRKAAKHAVPEDVVFANPAVAAAFKRSLKKYDAAYRRLTD